jgi:hypothetical protein
MAGGWLRLVGGRLLATLHFARHIKTHTRTANTNAPPPQALAQVASMQAIAAATTGPLQPRTRVLVASIRRAGQMAELAAQGCDTFTFAPGIMGEMLGVPETAAAVAAFEAAAGRNGGS